MSSTAKDQFYIGTILGTLFALFIFALLTGIGIRLIPRQPKIGWLSTILFGMMCVVAVFDLVREVGLEQDKMPDVKTWANDDLLLYHGTDDKSARKIISVGIDLSLCNPLTDFGRGFYTTTNLEQAKNWAVLKAKKIRTRNPDAIGTVIELRVSRTWLGTLESLAFVRDRPD